MNQLRHPLSWYVEKLLRREPFSSLLYGDGEMMVAAGERLGEQFTQHKEVVTPQLRDEMLASLDEPGDDIIRGTDLNLINYEDYTGQDWEMFKGVGRSIARLYARCETWVDGVVWEDAMRAGKFGPVFQALWRREVLFVGNQAVAGTNVLKQYEAILAPGRNAAGALDVLERHTAARLRSYGVCVVCTGLGAIPLILRLCKRHPTVTYLDLGSVLDVYCSLSPERGWRRELYADRERHKALLAANLEGFYER